LRADQRTASLAGPHACSEMATSYGPGYASIEVTHACTLDRAASAARCSSNSMAFGLRSTPTKRSAGNVCARGRSKFPDPQPKSTTQLPGGGDAAASIEAKFST